MKLQDEIRYSYSRAPLPTALVVSGTALLAAALLLAGAAIATGSDGGAPETDVLVSTDPGQLTTISPRGVDLHPLPLDVAFGVVQRPEGVYVAGVVKGGRDCRWPPCERTGVWLYEEIDGEYVERYEWSYEIPKADNNEVHDFEVINETHLLIAGMYRERVFVVNRTSSDVEWQWNASSRYPPPEDSLEKDWLHINDVDIVDDGRYMVSVRNANQIVFIERGRGVVDVINRDQSRETLFQQHNPQWLAPGAVLVADSENNRVVELHERGDVWVPVWEVRRGAGQELHWPRDADRLPNGNTLITDTRNHRVLVVRPDKSVVWSRRTNHNYEADIGGELVGGPVMNGSESGATGSSSPSLLHAIDLLYAAVSFYVDLPYWIGSTNLALALAGGTTIVIGRLGLHLEL